MANRQMQTKCERAARERAAIAVDLSQRVAIHEDMMQAAPYRRVDTTGEPSLAEMVAAFKGEVTVCEPGKYDGYRNRVSRVGSGSKAPAAKPAKRVAKVAAPVARPKLSAPAVIANRPGLRDCKSLARHFN